MNVNPERIREQMELCEKAVGALRRYHEARGVLSVEEVEKLREEAEALFGAVQMYLMKPVNEATDYPRDVLGKAGKLDC